MATNQILAPLGLDHTTFITRQREMSDGFISDITSAIVNLQAGVETIFAGLDDTGAHIYKVDDSGMTCCDSVGFAAIGSGARHAESQFMLANHSRNSSIVDTLLLTYIAKKRSEVAPGVGEETDIFFISDKGLQWIFEKKYIDPLQSTYRQMEDSQAAAFTAAKEELRRRAEALSKEEKAANEEKSPPTESK
jgi:hypothetical protein